VVLHELADRLCGMLRRCQIVAREGETPLLLIEIHLVHQPAADSVRLLIDLEEADDLILRAAWQESEDQLIELALHPRRRLEIDDLISAVEAFVAMRAAEHLEPF
jgi:hypothetical protein